MITLETIRAEINNRVQNSDKVILGVLGNLVKSHNEFCGCEYCLILKEYVRLKIRLHHRNKYNSYYFGRREYKDWLHYEEDLIYLKNKVKELKKQKDQIKDDRIRELNLTKEESILIEEQEVETINLIDFDVLPGYIVSRRHLQLV